MSVIAKEEVEFTAAAGADDSVSSNSDSWTVRARVVIETVQLKKSGLVQQHRVTDVLLIVKHESHTHRA